MISTKLILREDKANNRGEAPIYLRITKNRKHAYLATGMKVEIRFWDEGRCKLKSIYQNANAANALLRSHIFKAESFALELEPFRACSIEPTACTERPWTVRPVEFVLNYGEVGKINASVAVLIRFCT